MDGDHIVPFRTTDGDAGGDTLHLIAGWAERKDELGRAVAQAHIAHPLDRVRLLAPVARPAKIMALGLNYADHIAEAGLDRPTDQVWFCKQPSAVNPPHAPIRLPSCSDAVDCEVELVAVIGKRGRGLSRDEARSHVFGYCVGNDVTARDWQARTPQWMLAKSFDTHAPFGPWITTADEVGDPHCLDIRSFVNGDLRQNSNTRQLIYDVFDQIAYISQGMTLEPGDLIFTGTPGGVGAAMTPPVFLQNGDQVRCEIERLGALEATCVREAGATDQGE